MPEVGSKSNQAYLLIKEPGKDGGKETLTRLELQFNPKELSIDKAVNWNAKPTKGKGSPPAEFTGGEPRSLSVEVFLDATDRKDKKSIAADVETLFKACGPTPDSVLKNRPTPPYVTFGWGGTKPFEGFLESVNVKFTLFSSDGNPLRATATLKLKELNKEYRKQNPTSGSLAAMRVHTVVEGDNLASIAYKEYDDPALWRAVAEVNHIDDPLRVRPGTSLLLPDIDEANAYR